ncbi:MAG: hypothetical protein EOO05_14245 [Chitinophagaceae bacterium]|nr:MAG: hypothetical protein EOO05_14245 [Chitinophagaceae bacterium]
MLKFFLAVGISFLTLQSWAQLPDDTDSLKILLAASRDDSSRIDICQALEKSLFSSDPDSAMFYNQACEALIVKLNAVSRMHTCYHEFVRLYHAKYEYKDALRYCLKAIDAAARTGNKFNSATSYRALFNIYHNLRQNDLAVKYGLYSLQLTESIGDTSNIATNYGNLCWLYKDLAKYDKAIEFGEKGVAAGKRYKDPVGMLISLNNLANCYLTTNRNDKAIELFNQLLVAGKEAGRRRSVRNALINLGAMYYSTAGKDQLAKTVSEFNEYVKGDETMSKSDIAFGHLINGQNFIFQGRFEDAEKVFDEGIRMSEKDSLINSLLDLYNNMSKLQFAMHNYKKGNEYEDKWSNLDQSVRAQDLAEYESDLNTRYETSKKEDQIVVQQVQLRQKTLTNYYLAGGGVLLIVSLLLLYRVFRQRQRLQKRRIAELETEKQLAATEAVLKGEELERTRLAKDLHDGLGGMLSGIKYSLNAVKGNLVMTPENTIAFERSVDMLDSSIREMRRVAHNMMPESLVKFGLHAALMDFCNDINQSGAIKVSYQGIGLEAAEVGQTTAIAIYRIVQELINNTMKHAGAESAMVQVTRTGNMLTITVEDDGKGFDPLKVQEHAGMGWTNIRTRVEFLKGKLDVSSEPGKGTSVFIELPA